VCIPTFLYSPKVVKQSHSWLTKLCHNFDLLRFVVQRVDLPQEKAPGLLRLRSNSRVRSNIGLLPLRSPANHPGSAGRAQGWCHPLPSPFKPLPLRSPANHPGSAGRAPGRCHLPAESYSTHISETYHTNSGFRFLLKIRVYSVGFKNNAHFIKI